MAPSSATLHIADSTVVVIVKGDVDFATASELARRLDDAVAADPDRVIVNLGATSFMDCHGLRVIALAAEALSAQSELVVQHPRPLIAKAIRILKLDETLVMEN
jgi:anti-sigma B factor antagonist